METIDNAQFADDLGHFYLELGREMGDYLSKNIRNLSDTDYDELAAEQGKMLTYAQQFLDLADNIAFDESAQYFDAITRAKGEIDTAIKHIDNVDKAIKISAGIIGLAEAVVTKDGGGILSALQMIGS